jgi:UDP-glucose 4-epimerase
MKIFLTGGTGFIGSYVVKALSDKGHNVTILARNPDKVPAIRELAGVTIAGGLITDLDVIEEHLHDKDACIHIALGWGDLATSMLKNDTFPSVFLFETAGRLGVKRFIYTSSTAAMGNLSSNADEKGKPEPSDFYGATKASSECFLLAVSHKYDMRCNIIRPGYTFGNPIIEGASMESDDRFKKIARDAIAGNKIDLVRFDGTQFIWAGDLARLYLAVLDSDANRQTYFGLGSEFVSWEKIVKKAIELAGSKSTISLEDRGYSREPLLYDVELMRKEYGFAFESWGEIVKHIGYLMGRAV